MSSTEKHDIPENTDPEYLAWLDERDEDLSLEVLLGEVELEDLGG